MLKTILFLFLSVVLGLLIYMFNIVPAFTLTSEELTALIPTASIMLVAALLCFIVSEISKNYSQTDKLWSTVPIVYAWVFACQGSFAPRLIIMASLVSIWGLRLSANFSRRGGFPKNLLKFWESAEDYRWAVLQNLPLFKGKKFRWTMFNFFFISLYQHALILLFTLPAFVAMLVARKADEEAVFCTGEEEGYTSFVSLGTSTLNLLDFIAMGLFLLFVILETIADQQQYTFQTEKRRQQNADATLDTADSSTDRSEYERGFCQQGLWKYSRHPNFLAEQLIWISFYLFSVAATGKWINISIVGVILLLLLFRGSSDFSEKISAEKYPEYKDYQKKVGRFMPKFTKKS